MANLRVGVIRGGISDEYPVSLNTGNEFLKHLSRERHSPQDILIDREGRWHLNGWAKSPEKILRHIDVALIALHGYWGEDGKLQKILESFKVPYAGSGPMASAIGMNKIISKKIFKQYKLKTPHHVALSLKEYSPKRLVELYRSFPQPSVVKPHNGGSSQYVVIARDFPQFKDAIEFVIKKSGIALIEEYIKGREATCGILENFRGEQYYILPPVEILASQAQFFDYESKYDETKHALMCPAPFSQEEKKEIMRMARLAHEALGLRHLSRSDLIVSPRGVYILEVNTLPGMTAESLYPKAARVIGLPFPRLLDHLIDLALVK